MATIPNAHDEQINDITTDLASVIAVRAHYQTKDGSGELIYTYKCTAAEARTDRGARYMAEYIHACIKPTLQLVSDKQKLQLVEISTHELLINPEGIVKNEYLIDCYDINDM